MGYIAVHDVKGIAKTEDGKVMVYSSPPEIIEALGSNSAAYYIYETTYSALNDGARCPSKTWVAVGLTKRCIRAAGHPASEKCAWIEAENRSDGLPTIILWDRDVVKTYEYQQKEYDPGGRK